MQFKGFFFSVGSSHPRFRTWYSQLLHFYLVFHSNTSPLGLSAFYDKALTSSFFDFSKQVLNPHFRAFLMLDTKSDLLALNSILSPSTGLCGYAAYVLGPKSKGSSVSTLLSMLPTYRRRFLPIFFCNSNSLSTLGHFCSPLSSTILIFSEHIMSWRRLILQVSYVLKG